MQKHINYWIGFFSALLIAVIFSFVFWSISKNAIKNYAIFAIVATGSIISAMLLILFFRDWILKKTIGTQTATLEDISNISIRAVFALNSGETQKAQESAIEAVQKLIAWYTWSTFYRWVIGSCVALLVACAGFVGTILLIEQNTRILEQNSLFEKQNAIASLTMVGDLREQLLRGSNPEEVEITSPIETWMIVAEVPTSECSYKLKDSNAVKYPPNDAIISSIVSLAKSESLGSEVVRALIFLLDDRNASVVIGALAALSELEKLPTGSNVLLRDVVVQDLEIEGSITIQFERSFVLNSGCTQCDFTFEDSIFVPSENNRGQVVEGYTTFFGDVRNSGTAVSDDPNFRVKTVLDDSVSQSLIERTGFEMRNLDDSSESLKMEEDNIIFEEESVKKVTSAELCTELEFVAETNPFVEYLKETSSN